MQYFYTIGWRKTSKKENGGWNPTWPKLKELIKFKNLIKILMRLIGLIKDLIEEKSSLKSIWPKLKELIKFKDLI
jgi:hypothetical protein